jgi:DNA mismatch repair ATPase MutS
VLLGGVLLWDVQCAIALDAWRARAGAHARAWFQVLGEIETLATLASFAFDRPDHAWPELVDVPRFEARSLAHPLIEKATRIANDVQVTREKRALLITGSNMSGKSTFLRAMGTNAVLAHAGAPVCAASLTIGPLRLVTSMRIRDSLADGVSHFHAELQRIKKVLDMAVAPSEAAVFFLLDEILHGTNSRERVLGGRSVMRHLLASSSLGAVSTHDLGLSALETEHPERVQNVHFQEQIEGGRMTFDYKLRAGVVQSFNALRLMNEVGIDVSDALAEAARHASSGKDAD